MTAFTPCLMVPMTCLKLFSVNNATMAYQKASTGIIYACCAICGGTWLVPRSQNVDAVARSLLSSLLVITYSLSGPCFHHQAFALLVNRGFPWQFMVEEKRRLGNSSPVHLMNFRLRSARTFPGLRIQLGNLFPANTAVVEARFADHFRVQAGILTNGKSARAFYAGYLFTLILLAQSTRRALKGILAMPTAGRRLSNPVFAGCGLRGRFEERVMYTGHVALFYTCFCDSLRPHSRYCGSAALVPSDRLAQESALHRTAGCTQGQDAEFAVCTPRIHRVRDRHQFGLGNPIPSSAECRVIMWSQRR